MELEIRDTQSSNVVTIPTNGVTFGREGWSADLTVPDRTVSSKHAKIFARDAKWFIEDLHSSNGTFVNGERLSTPIELNVGDRFSLCRYGFEVVRVVGTSAPRSVPGMKASTAVLGSAAITDEPASTEQADVPTKDEGNEAALGYTPEGDLEPLPREPTAPAMVREPEGGGAAGKFFGNLGRATAYYLGAVPALLVNPVGFVRKGIAQQRFGAFHPAELIAWALPAFLVGALLSILSTTVYQLLWGQIGLSLFVTPLILVAVYVVAAVVTGFIWHPLLRWFVNLLQGESTDESRSNYFVMVYTGVILTFVPAAVAAFNPVFPEPLLAAIPMVLTLAANLILTFISYSWFRFFRVMKWFPILLVVLGGLSCVMTAKALVDLVRARVAGGAVTAPADGGRDVAAIQARIDELEKKLPSAKSDDEVKAIAAEMQALQQAKDAAAAGRTPEVPPAGDESPPDTGSGEPDAGMESPDGGEAAAGGVEAATQPASVPAGKTLYEEFVRKREAVETALERDPTLMKQKGVEADYRELHKISYKLRQKYKVKMGKKVTADKIAEQKVAEKKRDAEIFEQAANVVDRLYKRIVETR